MLTKVVRVAVTIWTMLHGSTTDDFRKKTISNIILEIEQNCVITTKIFLTVNSAVLKLPHLSLSGISS